MLILNRQCQPTKNGISFKILLYYIAFSLSLAHITHQVNVQQTSRVLSVKSSRDVSFRRTNSFHDQGDEESIFLESMEDLNHLTYLLLRNYNITDDGLLQASWLTGLSSALGSHQYSSAPTSITDNKSRLALELESFISHLRNGHLRRMSEEDLGSIVAALNLTESFDSIRRRHSRRRPKINVGDQSAGRTADSHLRLPISKENIEMTEKRCYYLVTLYKFDLAYRRAKSSQELNIPTDQTVSGKLLDPSPQMIHLSNMSLPNSTQRLSNLSNSIEFAFRQNKTNEETEAAKNQGPKRMEIDETRLLSLCKLAVTCQSAEDMVNLIDQPWRIDESPIVSRYSSKGSSMLAALPPVEHVDHIVRLKQSTALNRHQREPTDTIDGTDDLRESSDGDRESWTDLMVDDSDSGNGELKTARWAPHPSRKSLRDSLSLSLAKLCPLMLFQLHEDDEQCSIVRDDTPPILAVWGFATLFVTIVSFCSLIGLSITPLIGQSPTADDTSIGSSSSPSSTESSIARDSKSSRKALDVKTKISNTTNNSHLNQKQKATLTIFEGLAVGSLVGSALFSLIPQAFELQERESNQSFLLKAFIIFSGIYLFFCSERIMRIILDSRQNIKRNKRLNNRSSTTAVAEPIETAIVAQAVVPQFTPGPADQVGKTAQMYSTEAPQSSIIVGQTSLSLNQSNQLQDNVYIDKEATGAAGERIDMMSAPQVSSSYTSATLEFGSATIEADCGEYRQKTDAKQQHNDQRRKVKICDQSENLRNTEGLLEEKYQNIRHSSSISSIDSSTKNLNSWLSSSDINSSDDEGDVDSLDGDNASQDYVWSDGDERVSKHSSPIPWQNQNLGKQQRQTASSRNSNEWDERRAQVRNVFEMIDSGEPTRPRRNRLNSSDYNDLGTQHSKREISTVAWMIILGDGLHNFIDGISIGAAFSESILSGVSISVAVICEEFPHELGDFAVLVSSGMTVRQALGYNFLSACTCYFGMAVGIILGDVNDCASYISALAAGVFLYIALVDMMGELSAALEASSRDSIARTLKLLFLQNVGIFIGISIIFVLSFIDF